MAKKFPWIDNSSGDLLQYDFVPDPRWTNERVVEEQIKIVEMIDGNESSDGTSPNWLNLARRLPSELRNALITELRQGNRLVGIGTSEWPSKGSIIVNMSERFSVARQQTPIGVIWRELNDPHYCREELSQRVGPVEFLLIT